MRIRFFIASLFIFCTSIRAAEASLPSFGMLHEQIDTLITSGNSAEEYEKACTTILDNKGNLADEHKKKLWDADIIAQIAVIKDRSRFGELANYNPCFKFIEFHEKFESYKQKEDAQTVKEIDILLANYKNDNTKIWSHPAYVRLLREYKDFNIIMHGALQDISQVTNNLNGFETVVVDRIKNKLQLDAVKKHLARDSKEKAKLWKQNFLKAARQVRTNQADKWEIFKGTLKDFNPSCELLEADEALKRDDLSGAEKILGTHRTKCLDCTWRTDLAAKALKDINMDTLMAQCILNDAFKELQQSYQAKRKQLEEAKKKERELETAAMPTGASSVSKAIDTTIISKNQLHPLITSSTNQTTSHSKRGMVEDKTDSDSEESEGNADNSTGQVDKSEIPVELSQFTNGPVEGSTLREKQEIDKLGQGSEDKQDGLEKKSDMEWDATYVKIVSRVADKLVEKGAGQYPPLEQRPYAEPDTVGVWKGPNPSYVEPQRSSWFSFGGFFNFFNPLTWGRWFGWW